MGRKEEDLLVKTVEGSTDILRLDAGFELGQGGVVKLCSVLVVTLGRVTVRERNIGVR